MYFTSGTGNRPLPNFNAIILNLEYVYTCDVLSYTATAILLEIQYQKIQGAANLQSRRQTHFALVSVGDGIFERD